LGNSLLALGMARCASAEFARFNGIAELMTKAKVPLSWLPALAGFKTIALIGIVAGFWIPLVGRASAVGVIVYFLAAIAWHVGAHDVNITGAVFFLVVVAAALVLRLAASTAFGLGISCIPKTATRLPCGIP
jgi:DoxX-like family